MKSKKTASTLLLLLFSLLVVTSAQAGNGVPYLMPFQARVTDPTGRPITNPVVVQLRVYPPGPNGVGQQCYIYEEGFNVTPNPFGIFSIVLGAGVPSGPANTIPQSFNNDTINIPDSCGTFYNPGPNDWRRLEIVVDGVPLGAMQTIGASGFSINSQMLSGHLLTDFIQTSSYITQTNIEKLVDGSDASSLHNHDSTYAKLGSSNSFSGNLSTTGSLYTTAISSTVGIGTASTSADLHVKKDNPSIRLESNGGSGGVPRVDFFGGAVQRGSIRSDEATNGLKFYSGASLGLQLDSSANALFSQSVRIAGTTGLGQYTTAQEPALRIALAAGGVTNVGAMWVNSTTGKVKFWDGSTDVELADKSQVINTITAGNGIVVSGTATAPIISVSYGSLANTAIQGNASFGGDVSGMYTNISVDKIKGKPIDFSTAPNPGEILKYNGTSWISSTVASSLGYTPVNRAGDSMSGLLFLNSDPSSASGAATKQYVDAVSTAAAGAYVRKDGTTVLTSDWDLDGASSGTIKLTGLASPTAADGAATKGYVDTSIGAIVETDPNVPSYFKAVPSGRFVTVGNVLDLKTTGVVAATYGTAAQIGTFTVDTYGRITSASNTSIALPISQLTAGAASTGDLLWFNGTNWIASYDSKLIGKQLPAQPAVGNDGQSLKWDNATNKWVYFTPAAGTVNSVTGTAGQISNTGTATDPVLALVDTTVSAGTYGSASQVPVFTVDSKGRLTAASTVAALDTSVASFARTANPLTARLTTTGNSLDLATMAGVVQATYGSATQIPVLGVDTYGRIYTASSVSLATAVTAVETDPNVPSYFKTAPQARLVNNAGKLDLSTSGVGAATYGSSTQVPILTVDSFGRITAATFATASVTELDPTVHSFAKSANALTARLTTTGNSLDLANSGVSAGTYGSVSQIPILTVDQYGRVTVASFLSAAIAPSQITQGGASGSDVLKWNGSNWVPAAASTLESDPTVATYAKSATGLSARITTTANQLDLAASGVSIGTYGSTTQIPILTVDTYGRVTVASQTSLATAVNAIETDPNVPSYFKTAPQARLLNNAGKLDLSTSGVGAATYGSSTQVPVLTVDTFGRITAATFATASVTETDPSVATYAKSATGLSGRITTTANQLDLAASGVSIGTYGSTTQIPILTVDTYGRVTVASQTSLASAETDPLVPSYFKTSPQARLVNNAGKLDLSTSGVGAATYGSSTQVPVLTVDSFGRITAATFATASVTELDPTVHSFAKSANALTARLTTTGNSLDLANSGVSAGTYGSASQVPILTVDQYGRVTTASFLSASIGASQITAGGASYGQVLFFNGANWTASYDPKFISRTLPAPPTAGENGMSIKWSDASGSWVYFTPAAGTVNSVSGTAGRIVNSGTVGDPILDLVASGVSAATYGSLTQIPVVTVDSYGRVTAASSVSVASAVNAVENDPTVATYAKSATGLSARITTTANQLDLASSGVVAGTYGSTTTIPILTVDTYGRLTVASSTSLATAVNAIETDPNVPSYFKTAPQARLVNNAGKLDLSTSGVGAATYGSSTQVPVLTVDTFGRITAATFATASVTETDPSVATYAKSATGLSGRITTTANQLDLAASGVAIGTYGSTTQIPILTVDTYGRVTVASQTSLASAETDPLVPSYFKTAPQARLVNNAGKLDLSTSGVGAATYGAATQIPILTVDTYGRITAATFATATVTENDPTVHSFAKSANALTARLTTTGNSLDLASSGVAAATYGAATQIPILTVDTYGRITAATFATATVTENDPTVATYAKSATGLSARITTTANQLDLASSGVAAGTYGSTTTIPILTVDTYGRLTVASSTSLATAVNAIETDPNVPSYFKTAPQARLVNNAGKLDLGSSGVGAATYGSSTQVPILTVDTYGRITAATFATASVTEVDPTVHSFAKSANALTARLTTTGNSLDLASSGVAAATYGAATQIPILTVDTYGRITAATFATASVTETDPSVATYAKSATGLSGRITTTANQLDLAASGVTIGTYGSTTQIPILTVDTYGRVTVASQTSLASAETDPLVPSYFKTAPQARLVNNAGKLDLSTSGVGAATYGAATQIPVLTVDTYGRITAATFATASVTETDPTVATYAKNAPSTGLTVNGSNQIQLANSGVAAATYGASTQIPILTVDTYGRVTSATYASISTTESDPTVHSFAKSANALTARLTTTGNSLDLAASGVTIGTYGSTTQIPILTVDTYGRVTVASQTSLASAETDPLVPSYFKTAPQARLVNNAGKLDLSTSGVGAATYGSTTQIPVLTVDTYGRITSATFATASVSETDPSVATYAKSATGLSARITTTANQLDLANSGVSSGTYGSTSQIPIITVDQYGRVTTASFLSAAIAPSQITAGGAGAGDILRWSGAAWVASYDTKLIGKNLPSIPSAAQNGMSLKWDDTAQSWSYFTAGASTAVNTVTGTAGQITNTGTATDPILALVTTGVGAATYGSATQIPILTVDTYGRITIASQTSLASAETDPLVPSYFKTAPQARLVNNAGKLDLSTSGVGAATYGSGTQIPILTVDTYGRITAATFATASVVETDPSVATYAKSATGLSARITTTANQLDLAASGVSIGTYGSTTQIPILTVDTYGRVTVASQTSLASAETDPLVPSYFKTAPQARLVNNAGKLDLSTSGVGAATYGSGTQIPILTVDTYGRITAATFATASVSETDPTVHSFAKSANALTARLTTTGNSLDLASSGVAAATYGAATQIPILTVDTYGRITAATFATASVTETDPSVATYAKSATGLSARITTTANQLDLAASGVSIGTYGSTTQIPILTVDTYGRVTVASQTSLASAETDPLVPSYFKTAPQARLVNNAGKLDLSTSGVGAATYGAATQIPVLTVDTYGRITAATFATASVVESDPSVATYAKSATGLSGRITTTANQLDLAASGVTIGTYGSTTQIPILTVDTYGRVTIASQTSLASAETDPLVPSYFKTAPQARLANNAGKLDLSTSGVGAATYGSGTQIPILTVDTYGRITAATFATASVTEVDPTVHSFAKSANALTARLTTTGNSLDLASSGVAAATYGAATQIPILTVDTYGRITAATFATASVTETDPSVATYAKSATGLSGRITTTANQLDLAASGVTIGTYGSTTQIPILTVDTYGRVTVASQTSLASAETDPLVPSYFKTAPQARLVNNAGKLDLSTSGVGAATYGSGTQIPILTVDTYGRITAATFATASVTEVDPTVHSFAKSANALTARLTTTGNSLDLASSGVAAATYGAATQIPILTVDTYGRITAATFATASVTETDPSVATYAKSATGLSARITTTANQLDLAASGVSIGTYGSTTQIPILTVDTYGRVTVASQTSLASAETDPLVPSYFKTAPQARLVNNAGKLDLSTSGVGAATYGAATQIPVLTVDTYGRITAATFATASVVETDPSVATYAKSATGLSARITTTANQLDLAASGVTIGTYGSTTQIPILTVDTYGRVTVASQTSLASAETDPLVPSYFKTAPQARLVNNAGKLDLSTSGVGAATYGSGTQIPVLTVDTYGRITAATFATASVVETDPSVATYAKSATGLSARITTTANQLDLANSGVAAATYGSSTTIPIITVDQYGRVTTASTTSLTTAVNAIESDPTVATYAKTATGLTARLTTTANKLDLANSGVSAATYGSASQIPIVTVDIYGRISNASTIATAASYNNITAATATNTIDNTNFAQIWNWSTLSAGTALTSNANLLTTGTILSLATSNASVNSTNGLLYVGNTSASTSGTIARFQSNSTAGSGLTILANGALGIGTSTPSASYSLEATGTIKAQNLLLTSDRRLKTNIETLDGPESLSKILTLNPVEFDWKKDGAHDTGVIAQELEQIYPHMVSTGDDGMKAVRYQSLIAPLISSVQELNKKNEALAKENEELKSKLNKIERDTASVKDELKEIKDLLKSQGK